MAGLAEIGFLTPDETFEAMQTKRLPSKEESLEAQEEYKNFKDKGLYGTIGWWTIYTTKDAG